MAYRVRLGYTDTAALAAIDPSSTVVFVMNHRSNMDYILVSFLAAERVALSYAVGEWARIWPLQGLIRAMGAYFVRRNSGDPLYRMVLQRYVQMATEGGVPQAMYPEGGLTTDGRLRAPKLGLLDYMLKGFDPTGRARPRLHPGRHQLRPRPRGPLAAAQARSRPRRASAWRRRSRSPARFAGAPARARRARHGATATATPASTSARRCRCAATSQTHGVDFRALDDAGRRARGRRGRRDADGADRRDRPGPAGAAGRERLPARPGAGALRARAEGGGAGADATASRPPAATSTCRAPTATTRSPSACAC